MKVDVLVIDHDGSVCETGVRVRPSKVDDLMRQLSRWGLEVLDGNTYGPEDMAGCFAVTAEGRFVFYVDCRGEG